MNFPSSATGSVYSGIDPLPAGPSRGRPHFFEGRDLLTLGEKEMRRIRGNRIAMIFQEPMTSLNPIFTVGYQIKEVLRIHRQAARAEITALAAEILQKVGLPDPHRRLGEYPHQMSGSMRQRVMIAMALCCSPRLIIAYEPTTALDVTIQAQIIDLIQRLREDTGTAILLITHDLGVIAEMADTVALMYTGHIVEYATGDDLFGNPCHPYTRGLMGSVPKIDQPLIETRRLRAIGGVVPSLLELPAGCSFRERCPHVMSGCRRDPPFFYISDSHRVRCWLHES